MILAVKIASQNFCVSKNIVEIIFGRGVYVDKNTSQAASVEFVRLRRTNYAQSSLQKLSKSPGEDFRHVKTSLPVGAGMFLTT